MICAASANNICAFRSSSQNRGPERRKGDDADSRARAWQRIRRATLRIQEARKKQLQQVSKLAQADIEAIKEMFEGDETFDETKLSKVIDVNFIPDAEDSKEN